MTSLLGEVSLLEEVDKAVLDEVHRRYTEPQRHYHTLAHVERLLSLLATHLDLLTNAQAAVNAVLFHECV